VGQKLKARGFEIGYDTFWRHPIYVSGDYLDITAEDCQLIGQLPHLGSLHFFMGDMSGLNLDEIGNCQKLWCIGFNETANFSVVELRKLAASIRYLDLIHVDLKDSDLEVLTELPELRGLWLFKNFGVTDAGLEYLEKNPSLTRMLIDNTSFTQEGIAEFQKKRPDVRIVYAK